MSKRMLLALIGFVMLMDGAFLVLAQDKVSSPREAKDQLPIKYEAEEGTPKDKAGEKRRDYAVLEAALNDLTSPKNPEYKYHIQNVGPGREILIDDKTCNSPLLLIHLDRESQNIDNTDTRSIPAELREEFERRRKEPARSLSDFKPANPDILVRDFANEFKGLGYLVEAYRKKYPTAWGYVWAYPPGYSKDGTAAIVIFDGGPNGIHGLNWVYMLTRNGKRWEVQWRHCCPRV